MKDAVKMLLENNIDASTQSEIWRHYQGMENIDKQIGRTTKSRFSDSEYDILQYLFLGSDGIVAGQPVDLDFFLHQMLSRSPSLRQ